jgi:hypothetical protein
MKHECFEHQARIEPPFNEPRATGEAAFGSECAAHDVVMNSPREAGCGSVIMSSIVAMLDQCN